MCQGEARIFERGLGSETGFRVGLPHKTRPNGFSKIDWCSIDD